VPGGIANVVKEDPTNKNILYLGTDLAVYVTIDGGKAWNVLGSNLPTAYVFDLAIQSAEDVAVIGTHGRSAFVVDLRQCAPPPEGETGSGASGGAARLRSDLHGPDGAIRVELHRVDADLAMVAVLRAQRAAVVDDVPRVRPGNRNDGVMPRTRGHRGILLEDLADAANGPSDRRPREHA
jgi:hypothetical protein